VLFNILFLCVLCSLLTVLSSPFYTILYDDGDREELELNELSPW
jgi:hypothetical protein